MQCTGCWLSGDVLGQSVLIRDNSQIYFEGLELPELVNGMAVLFMPLSFPYKNRPV